MSREERDPVGRLHERLAPEARRAEAERELADRLDGLADTMRLVADHVGGGPAAVEAQQASERWRAAADDVQRAPEDDPPQPS